MPHLFSRDTPLRTLIAKNTAAQIAARIISAGTTFCLTVVIARRFGAQGLGDFIKITTYLAFFYLLADFGLNAVYLQNSPPEKNLRLPSSDRPWEDLLILRICLSAVLAVVAILLLFFLPRGTGSGYTDFVRVGIVLFIPSIVFQALTTTANALFQKHLRYDMSAVSLAAGSVATLLFLFLIIKENSAAVAVQYGVLSVLTGAAVTAATGLILTRKFQRTHHSEFAVERIERLFVAAIPLGITLLFNLVYFRIDSIILTLTRSTEEVGIYGFAYKLFELFLVLPTFFMNAVYPMMVRDDKQFSVLVKRSAYTLSLLSVAASLVLIIAAPVVAVVRGDMVQGVAAVRVLSAGLPFFFLSSLTMWILIAKKKQMLLAKIYGASMVVNILLNILFIPAYGFMAAAWITVISEAVVLMISVISVRRLKIV